MSNESGINKEDTFFSSFTNEFPHMLSVSQVKSALTEAIATLNQTNNLAKINAARNVNSAGHQFGQHAQLDTIRHMQHVFPLMTDMLADVVHKYGLAKSGEGVVQFMLIVKDMEKSDADIERLNNTLKSHLLFKFN